MRSVSIGQLIRFIRKSKGITATFLASKLNVSTSTMWKIENGLVQVKAQDVPLIANALGVEVTVFFDQKLAENANHGVDHDETA